MGVRGLNTFIKTRLSQTRKSIQFETQAPNQTWGIDASSIMFRARSESLSPTTIFASLIVKMRRSKITPIVVFDGRSPDSKTAILEKRRTERSAARTECAKLVASGRRNMFIEDRITALQQFTPVVTSGDRDEVRELLAAAGVLFVTVQEEADDMLGFLSRTGVVDAVVSNDTDMLVLGVERFIIPETCDATVMTEIRLSVLLRVLNLTYDKFIVACMFMGTDNRMPGGWIYRRPELAIDDAVAYHTTDHSILEALHVGIQRFKAAHVTDVCAFLAEEEQERWAAGKPACNAEIVGRFATSRAWPSDWSETLTVGG